MNISGIDFPKPLLNSVRNGDLVVFAGAGVSMGAPANLPDFKALTEAIAQETGETLKCGEPEDRFLGRLEHQGVAVHERAAELLSGDCIQPTPLHLDLLELFSTSKAVRLVTTNFDALFDKAAEEVFDEVPVTFNAPALPLGAEFAGVVNLHGTVDVPKGMILTDEDFGRAYFIEGWARRFSVELLRSSTVLFVGYSYNDVVMHYLTRALPKDDDTSLFALTDDAAASRWGMLGIRPIAYPRAPRDNHIALQKGVEGLGTYASRRILDWKREIADIATNHPSLDEEAMDLVDDALSDPTHAHFFTDVATHPDWIAWLERRGHLDHLFGTGNSVFSEVDRQISGWLANTFAVDHADDLFSLLARQGMRIHPNFWWALGFSIGLQKEHPPNPEVLAQWVSALLATRPTSGDSSVLPWLGQRCIEANLTNSILDIFAVMTSSSTVLRPGIEIPEFSTMLRVRGETALDYDYNSVNALWQGGLKPRLERVAETLLGYIVQNLTAQHRALIPWHAADREDDNISLARWSIDSERTYGQTEPIDVLIDAARDCLVALAGVQRVTTASWCDLLIRSDVPILRRLSMHTLSYREDLTADQKIDWVLEHIELYDLTARREIFRAVENIYPETSENKRTALIDEVLAYVWPYEDDDDRERLAAREHFNWLRHLQNAEPSCELVRQAISQTCDQYPEFQGLEAHDGTRLSFSSGRFLRAGAESPWSVAELLARCPCEWVDNLLTFREERPLGPNREGLLNTVRDAAVQKFDWGLVLADKLGESDNWDTDLWPALIKAWTRELDEDSHRAVLDRLSNSEIISNHVPVMGEFLLGIVKDGGWNYASNLLEHAMQIALDLRRVLDPNEQGMVTNDWLLQSVNHPSGSLAQFWLHSLSLTRSQQDSKPDALEREYATAFSEIIHDDSVIGTRGKTILASQLAFLVATDEFWTGDNLIPLFEDTDGSNYRPVWHGFVRNHLNPRVAELLHDAFLDAIPHMGNIFPNGAGHLRREFVRLCTGMIVYFVKDPLDSWIPKLFSNAETHDRLQFAWDVAQVLEETEDSDQKRLWNQWLSRYWINRLQGVPTALEAKEVEAMLDWLKCFDSVYPQAAECAIRMLPTTVANTSIIRDLNKSDLWSKYPEVTTRLVLKLAESNPPLWVWYEGDVLTKRLLAQDLAQDLKTDLEDLRARLRFDSGVED